jgi:hypothetical protein
MLVAPGTSAKNDIFKAAFESLISDYFKDLFYCVHCQNMFLYSRLQVLLHQLYIREYKNSGVEDCLPVAPDRMLFMEFLAAELSFLMR